MTKYNNSWVEVNGIKFQSKAESERYLYLLDKQERGEIKNLKLQPVYQFIIRGQLLKTEKGRVLKYVADFSYHEPVGNNVCKLVAEDVKGYATDVWKIKFSLAKAMHPATEFVAVYKKKGGWDERRW